MFPTRKLWLKHDDTHRFDIIWRCPLCRSDFDDSSKIKDHLTSSHSLSITTAQLGLIISAAQHREPHSIENQVCPLCNIIPGKSRRNYANHVGGHMESIALAALPHTAEDSSDEASVESVDDHRISIYFGKSSQDSSAEVTTIKAVHDRKSVRRNMKDFSSSHSTHLAPSIDSVVEPAPALRLLHTLSPNGSIAEDDEEYIIKCICDFQEDDGNTVYCEKCETWQHIICYYDQKEVPDLHNCADCEPRSTNARLATERQKRNGEQPDTGGRSLEKSVNQSQILVIEKKLRWIRQTNPSRNPHHRTGQTEL